MNPIQRPAKDPVDDEIQKHVAEGDVDALRRLYQRHSSQVYSLCLRMLRDEQRAEEVMQDVFLQFWQKPGQFDSERGKLSTFLFQVARSRCLDRLRSERSQADRVRAATAEWEPMREIERAPSALETAIGSEEQARVRGALDQLSQDFREVVVLTYFDGLTQAEIASRLEMPLGTIKTRVRRGLLQLRRNLQVQGAT